MNEGRAKENSILLRLATIISAASPAQPSDVINPCFSVVPGAVSAIQTVELPLQADDWRHTGLCTRSDRDQKAEEVMARPTTTCSESAKSGGSLPKPKRSLAPVGKKAMKQIMGKQGSCIDMIAARQSECDVVVFPYSVQV